MTIRKIDGDAYFAASNSAQGFYSYYTQCFDSPRVRQVFAVKGGPGTGKSRFLREVADLARTRGREIEYIYCSSDPDSLDGVILTGKDDCIALLDATAPHIYEPSRPGVREDIVHLGTFWDREQLWAHAEEIEALNTQKSEAYRQAYRYLACLGEMTRTRDELIAPFVHQDAIARFAERLMRDIPNGEGYEEQTALMSSIGMRGEVFFDTYLKEENTVYLIEDCRGCAQYLTAQLYRLAKQKGLQIRVSHDPIMPQKLDAILLCDFKIAFVVAPPCVCDQPCRILGMRRFVDTAEVKSIREVLNRTEAMRRALLKGATERLERVREAHFRLESIYMSAMDFDAKEKFTKSFCDALFDLQNS